MNVGEEEKKKMRRRREEEEKKREGKRPAVIRIWNTPRAKMIIATILVMSWMMRN